MLDQEKQHLPLVLSGISLKIYSIFFGRLVLFDEERLYSKHQRHYDYECEGLENLIDFISRKNLKNLLLAFQTIKNPQSAYQQSEEGIEVQPLRIVETKSTHIKYGPKTTGRTRNLTHANTSIEESDGSYIYYSPNIHNKQINRNKTLHNPINIMTDNQEAIGEEENHDQTERLRKLFLKVKKVNTETYQESLYPNHSSYFHLGSRVERPSTHTINHQSSKRTYYNASQGPLTPLQSPKTTKENKKQKRRRILERFESLEYKIQNEEPSTFTERKPSYRKESSSTYTVYEEPVTINHSYQQQYQYQYPQERRPVTAYQQNYEEVPYVQEHYNYEEIYEPITFQEGSDPNIVYVEQPLRENEKEYYMSSSKSVSSFSHQRERRGSLSGYYYKEPNGGVAFRGGVQPRQKVVYY